MGISIFWKFKFENFRKFFSEKGENSGTHIWKVPLNSAYMVEEIPLKTIIKELIYTNH